MLLFQSMGPARDMLTSARQATIVNSLSCENTSGSGLCVSNSGFKLLTASCPDLGASIHVSASVMLYTSKRLTNKQWYRPEKNTKFNGISEHVENVSKSGPFHIFSFINSSIRYRHPYLFEGAEDPTFGAS